MGVNGFLISCATCFAISRHALSFSFLASSVLLCSRFPSIRLYSLTIIPISSLAFHSMGWLLPREVVFNFLAMKRNGEVSLPMALEAKNENRIKTIENVTRIFERTLDLRLSV